MLLELNIEHFVVADRLRMRFGPGLNLLTGETGSGKSIIVDALSLLLGRARRHRGDSAGTAERPGFRRFFGRGIA